MDEVQTLHNTHLIIVFSPINYTYMYKKKWLFSVMSSQGG